MREFLNIGELADILNVSTSKIRYYEKIGILKPLKIDENGYRLYDFKQLDRLDAILLLRDLGVSIKELKTILANYSIDNYVHMLNKSLTKIDEQIADLQEKRIAIMKKVNTAISFNEDDYKFKVISFPKRELVCLHIGAIFDYSIKKTYDIFKLTNLPFINLYESSYFTLHNNDIHCMYKEYIDIEGEQYLPRLELPAGEYLCHGFFVGEEISFESEVNRFKQYIKKNELKTYGELIFKENYRNSNYYADKFYMTIQIKLNEF